MVKLGDFINVCNLEGTFSCIDVLEYEDEHITCFRLFLCCSPKIDLDFQRIEQYFDYEVTNVDINIEDKRIMISIKEA